MQILSSSRFRSKTISKKLKIRTVNTKDTKFKEALPDPYPPPEMVMIKLDFTIQSLFELDTKVSQTYDSFQSHLTLSLIVWHNVRS